MVADKELDQVVGRVAQGDQNAFAALYDALGPLVYGVSLRVIGNPALAEESSQEVFLQVWQGASRFDHTKGSAKTWVATIAHRRAVDTVRHDQAAIARDMRWNGRHSEPPFDIVAETADVNDEHLKVRRALRALTPLQRQSIGLAYYAGLTYREVAQKLRVKPATVKTRMRDGLTRLRSCLDIPQRSSV